jgi:CTP-dependent riboflavin kinase
LSGASHFSGTVQPGRGLGSALMADCDVVDRLEALAGFRLVPGTLNVRLSEPLERGPSWRYVAASEVEPDWEARTGQAGYFILAVVVCERHRGLAFQAEERDEPGYPPDQIELLSEVHLRGELGLVDGDPIEVRELRPAE